MDIKLYWNRLNHVKNLRNYFLISAIVIFGLNLNTSIFFLYPLSLGLNFLEMTFVYFSLTRIIYLLFLIPTGAIADKYSVKACISLTFLAYAIGYLLRGTLPFIIVPFIAFLISETMIGLAGASYVGASDKYLYSFRKKISDSKIFSTQHTIMFATRAVSCLVGAFIVYFSSMRWTQIIGGLIIFVGFLLSLKYLKEPEIRKNSKPTAQLYKEGFSFALRHRKTFYLIAGLSLLGLGIFASRNVFQPLLSELGLDINNFAVAFGLIFTFQMLFSGFGSFVVQKIDKRIKLSLMILLTLSLMGLFLFSMTLTGNILLVVLLIWLFAFAEGSQYTQATIQLNRFIGDEHIRATVNSVSSLVSALILAIFIPVIGALTDQFGISMNLYISAVLILIGAIILYIPYFNNKTSKEQKQQARSPRKAEA